MTTPPSLPPCKRSSCISQLNGKLSRVSIYHAIAERCFLTFLAQPYPIEGGFSPVAGLPRSLIIDSCRILTGTYTENVFICPRNDPTSSLQVDFLSGGDYVYVVGSLNEPANYGVYTDFTTWNPPTRTRVPDHWFTQQFAKEATSNDAPSWAAGPFSERAEMHSSMSAKVKALDSYICSLSLVESTTAEGCHVVPVELKTFYTTREIHSQLLPPGPIPITLGGEQEVHDVRNFVTLGTTIHRLWDSNIMGFYPLSPGSYTAFFFQADGNAELYHLKDLHLRDHTDPYLMFVRFALTVFNFRPRSYNGDQPTDALPPCVSVNASTRTRGSRLKQVSSADSSGEGEEGGGGGGGDRGMLVDSEYEECDVESSHDESRTHNGVPIFVLNMLFDEAAAEGKMLPEALQAMVGHYYPETEKTRIESVRMEYLKSHPEVGMLPGQHTV